MFKVGRLSPIYCQWAIVAYMGVAGGVDTKMISNHYKTPVNEIRIIKSIIHLLNNIEISKTKLMCIIMYGVRFCSRQIPTLRERNINFNSHNQIENAHFRIVTELIVKI